MRAESDVTVCVYSSRTSGSAPNSLFRSCTREHSANILVLFWYIGYTCGQKCHMCASQWHPEVKQDKWKYITWIKGGATYEWWWKRRMLVWVSPRDKLYKKVHLFSMYILLTTAYIHREVCVRFIIPQCRSFREEPLQHFALTQSLNYQNITPLIVQ